MEHIAVIETWLLDKIVVASAGQIKPGGLLSGWLTSKGVTAADIADSIKRFCGRAL